MFDKITPEYLSYIIGFLQGDGSHSESSRNRGKIVIELAERDKDILDKMQAILSKVVTVKSNSRTRDTNFKKNYSCNSISIYDINFRKWASKFVPVSKKAKVVSPPINELWFVAEDYIRGLTDADGSLGVSADNKPFWSLCTSSEDIKIFILNYLEEKMSIEKRLSRNKRDDVYNIVLLNEDALNFSDILYKEASLYLDRKYSSFNDFKNWKRTVPKRKGRCKKWLSCEDEIVLNKNIPLLEKVTVLKRTRSSIKTRHWRLKQK